MKPRKELWVIQAKWHEEKSFHININNKECIVNEAYDSDSSDDYMEDVQYENKLVNTNNTIDSFDISSKLLYCNKIWNNDIEATTKNINSILPILETNENENEIKLKKMPTILEWNNTYNI